MDEAQEGVGVNGFDSEFLFFLFCFSSITVTPLLVLDGAPES